jgi:hypothetical protein
MPHPGHTGPYPGYTGSDASHTIRYTGSEASSTTRHPVHTSHNTDNRANREKGIERSDMPVLHHHLGALWTHHHAPSMP